MSGWLDVLILGELPRRNCSAPTPAYKRSWPAPVETGGTRDIEDAVERVARLRATVNDLGGDSNEVCFRVDQQRAEDFAVARGGSHSQTCDPTEVSSPQCGLLLVEDLRHLVENVVDESRILVLTGEVVGDENAVGIRLALDEGGAKR